MPLTRLTDEQEAPQASHFSVPDVLPRQEKLCLRRKFRPYPSVSREAASVSVRVAVNTNNNRKSVVIAPLRRTSA
jgi:hypothetical protein